MKLSIYLKAIVTQIMQVNHIGNSKVDQLKDIPMRFNKKTELFKEFSFSYQQ